MPNKPVTVSEYCSFVRAMVDEEISNVRAVKKAIYRVSEILGCDEARVFDLFYSGRVVRLRDEEIKRYPENRIAYLRRKAEELEARSQAAWEELATEQRRRQAGARSRQTDTDGNLDCDARVVRGEPTRCRLGKACGLLVCAA